MRFACAEPSNSVAPTKYENRMTGTAEPTMFQLTRTLGDPIGISGTNVVLLVALVLAAAAGIESPAGRAKSPNELKPAPLVI